MSSDLFLKIQANDLTDQVYERLKQAITTNVIRPGERIDIERLAEQWGVSRSPIKDAIARLAGEGFAVVRPKVGTYATQFTVQDMMELYAIRLLLEGGICREILANITRDQFRELERIQSQLGKEKTRHDYFLFNALDSSFHEQLVRAAGNSRLLEVHRSLHFHAQVARFYYDRYEDRRQTTLQDHGDMIEAIRQKDFDRLETSVKRHIISGREQIREFMNGRIAREAGE